MNTFKNIKPLMGKKCFDRIISMTLIMGTKKFLFVLTNKNN